ncbi:class I SAM-dependent methyltransferase [uncultured Roseovarius sp.]|uniref:class I SAM-dependent methyltransferase n=1 Tax=uncultured Roseovarius sp. TaxID=293344 RepID=UPI00262A15B2|nr:class I SAM-dependent methyltransferase [uncultured Roseovarius sp.]
MTEETDTSARLLAILAQIDARDVLDIGCGHGGLSRKLDKAGYAVTGIDPDAEGIASAYAKVPNARFYALGAERLPFDAAAFDACIFLNSLHHVPVPVMQDALREALRVLRPGGEVVIVEPLAQGPFFEVMRPVEDETEIRQAAIDSIDAVLLTGEATGPAAVTYARPTPVADTGAFITYLARVDPARRAIAEARHDQIERLFAEHATQGAKGPELIQPLRVWRLRPVEN